MGYANPGQRGEGLHLRQFARSFIVSSNGNSVVFVTIDAAMVSIAVKLVVSLIQYTFLFNQIYK